MLSFLGNFAKTLAIAAVAGVVIGGVYWWLSQERVRELTPLMQQLADETTRDLQEGLPRVQTVDTLLVIMPARGPRDEEAQFRASVVDAIRSSDKYKIKEWGYVEDQVERDAIVTILAKLGIPPGTKDQPETFEQAKSTIKELYTRFNLAIDGVLYLDLQKFNEGPHSDGLGATIQVSGKVWSVTSEKIEAEIPTVTHAITSSLDLRYVRHRISTSSVFLRFLGFFVIAAGLPWVLITLVRAVLKKKQNQLNALLLVGFTLIDLLLAWVLLGALDDPLNLGTMLLLLLAGGGMGYYNFDALDYIERRLL